jgi:hypothetical protein
MTSQKVEPQYAPAGSPLIYANTAFFRTSTATYMRLDVLSGNLIWRADYNQPVNGASGPAIGYAKLYVQAGGSLRALALDTGEELWSTPLQGRSDAHQPYVYGELILTSTRQVEPQLGEEAASGWFYAIHHETGQSRVAKASRSRRPVGRHPVEQARGCLVPTCH